MREYHFYVYILTDDYGNVMDNGVTNDLVRRVWEHKEEGCEGFTKKYHVHKLVYYECLGGFPRCHPPGKGAERLDPRKKERAGDVRQPDLERNRSGNV